MKRGWITWDKTELPPSAFESRLAVLRQHLAAADLPAVVIYTDIWKSNQGRYFSNIMPYWNRALLVIPRDSAPILLCGLSPRVYPWIRSVTILDEIRPSQNIPLQLSQLRTEKGWTKVGVLDLPQIPWDLAVPNAVDVPWNSVRPQPDDAELSMHRLAAKMAREILAEEIPHGVDAIDHAFVGRLERRFRRAGAEDLLILLTNGATPPLPPNGSNLGQSFSLTLALEYRGHWAKISRSIVPHVPGDSNSKTELLSGPYPWEACNVADLTSGALFALHTETRQDGRRLFQGDSYWQGPNGAELL